jgi:hypothetical protein
MLKDHIVWWKRESAFAAVRLFGDNVFKRYRRENAKHLLSEIYIKNLTPISWTRGIPLNQFVA